MRFLTTVECLAKAMHVATGLVPARTPKAIYKAVLLRADKRDGVKFTVCQINELACVADVRGCSVELQGEVLVSPDRVGQVLATLAPDLDISVSVGEEGSLVIKSAFSEFESQRHKDVLGCDPEEYPEPKVFGDPSKDAFGLTVNRDDLFEAINRVKFCAKTHTSMDARFSMLGISLWPVVSGGKCSALELVATDGGSLAATEIAVSEWSGRPVRKDVPRIISTRCLPAVLGVFSGSAVEVVDIWFEPEFVLVKSPRAVVACWQPVGRYPEWEAILKKPADAVKFSAPAVDTMKAISLASICCNRGNKHVALSLKDGNLRFSSVIPMGEQNVGRSSAEVPVPTEAVAKCQFNPDCVAAVSPLLESEDVIDFAVPVNPKGSCVFLDVSRIKLRTAFALSQS